VKHKLGLIVPYRDREEHLKQFIPHMQRFLKIPYHLFIIEQADEKPFNRGKLLNIGFEIAKSAHCDYICFHDVDMLPVEADYSYPDAPTHLATRVEQFDYGMPYPSYFGGVTLFNCADFAKVNGYSNAYWGWGLEDDDLHLRCSSSGLTTTSRDGIFHSLSHDRPDDADPALQANQDLFEEYLYGTKNIWEDGLSTLQFNVVSEEHEKTLSRIKVALE
jgi:hypothetical protein